MALMEKIKVPLEEAHKEAIRKIDEFDYSAVAKKVSRDLGGLPSTYLDEGIENLKLYYVVALLDPLNAHAVSRPVDPFWHAHVLFTRDYIAFCKDVFGQYVHHQPLDENDRVAVEEVERLYSYTLRIYESIFNSYNRAWWTEASHNLFRPVCLHAEIQTQAITDIALFPRLDAMQATLRIAPQAMAA